MGIINRKLEQWLQAELITPTQRDAILDFESQQPQRANWWLYSFMVLGAAIIGLGIISLIAANWSEIPDGVKLGVDFALLALLAGGIYHQYTNHRHGVGSELLLIAFLLLCLASIGLISQVFHSGGTWYHALLFWAAITFPLALFARHLLTRFVWVTLFLHGALWSMISSRWWAGNTSGDWDIVPAAFLLAPLLSALLYGISRQFQRLRGFESSFFFWFQISAIVALVFADINRSADFIGEIKNAWAVPSLFIAGLLAASIVLQRDYTLLNKVLLLGALGLLLLYYHPNSLFLDHASHDETWFDNEIRAPLLSLSILFLYAIHAGNIGHRHTFNLVTFLIGLRFVVLYFQAVGGLAATGVGLIVSGILILTVAWVWHTGRDHLRIWATGGKA